MPETEDVELVRRARGGDAGAFGVLVKRWQERVYRLAYHMTGAHEEADDVAQEAFLKAYRGLGSFDDRAGFGTWLHRIVVNSALNHLRARRRRRERQAAAEAGETVASTSPSPAGRAEARQLTQAVLAALERLLPALRVTLVLATLEEMPYREIAQTLGVPEGTVAWRVNQARKTLRRLLAPELPATQGDVDEVLRRTKAALGAP